MDLTPPPGHRLETHRQLKSTNDTALAALASGEAGPLWVHALQQVGGRGRRGRPWSGGNDNLAVSLALAEAGEPSRVATLSLVAGLSLHRAVVAVAGPATAERLSLKWPNDLLLDNRKVAGILVEGHTGGDDRVGVVIGWGVNCNSHPGLAGRHASISLREGGFPVMPRMLLGSLMESVAKDFALWRTEGGFDQLRQDWLDRASGIGQPIVVHLAVGEARGVFETLDADGNLVIRSTEGNRQSIAAGEVVMARGSA